MNKSSIGLLPLSIVIPMIIIVSSRLINTPYHVQEMKASLILYHLICHVGYKVNCFVYKQLCIYAVVTILIDDDTHTKEPDESIQDVSRYNPEVSEYVYNIN